MSDSRKRHAFDLISAMVGGVPPVRAFDGSGDDDDPDGKKKSGGQQVSMSQSALDGLMANARREGRDAEKNRIKEKYGDLEDLKAKATAAAEAGGVTKKDLDDALKRAEDAEAERDRLQATVSASERTSKIVAKLTAVGYQPEKATQLAQSFQFKAEDVDGEDFTKEIDALKSIVPPAPGGGKPPMNPGGPGGESKAASLSEAVAKSYGTAQ